MKIRKQSDGSSSRLWERGVISSDCGEHGHDDIDYFSQYKPDIDGTHEAMCDYYFNETVLAYSHDNIRHLGHTFNDLLNIWAMLWMTDNLSKVKVLTRY